MTGLIAIRNRLCVYDNYTLQMCNCEKRLVNIFSMSVLDRKDLREIKISGF